MDDVATSLPASRSGRSTERWHGRGAEDSAFRAREIPISRLDGRPIGRRRRGDAAAVGNGAGNDARSARPTGSEHAVVRFERASCNLDGAQISRGFESIRT